MRVCNDPFEGKNFRGIPGPKCDFASGALFASYVRSVYSLLLVHLESGCCGFDENPRNYNILAR